MGIVRLAACAVLFAACAKAGEAKPDGSTDGRPPVDGTNGDSGTPVAECPADQFATNVDANGLVTCATIEAPTKTAVDSSCSVYLGHRDNCDGCITPPAKWGRAGALDCSNGAGADNRCITSTLGGAAVQLFGLNLDGDADGNDKFYSSLHCIPPAPAGGMAPCPAGEFITGTYGGSWTCAPMAVAAIEYVRANCQLYAGWQDSCDGCTTIPAKWGRSSDLNCLNGAGADNTCTVATLGAESLNLYGLNADGDMNGDDKLHVGMHCATPPPAEGTGTTACPAGMYMTGTEADGGFKCESPAPLIAKWFTDHCSVYYGWTDGCDGCAGPPSKWGRVGVGACANGLGAANTCSSFALGGQQVSMFGLNTDGDVDGNDTLYIGFQCAM